MLFYSNENFILPVVEGLRRLGHNVLTVAEAGKAEQRIADDEVLSFAVRNKRAVLTINRKHFVRLHRSQRSHYGIVVCSLDLDFSGQAKRIHKAVGTSDLKGKLIRVNRPG